MQPVLSIQEVFEGILQSKKSAEFCTNFFPSRQNLDAWIGRKMLNVQTCGETVFFFRRDRDFWHLYFCSPNLDALQRDLSNLRELGTERVVTDLIGSPESLDGWMPAMENAGFQPYKHLARMARTTAETALPRADVTFAERRDIPAILCFLEEAFDRYSKQLPAPEEIEAAVDASQILLSKSRPMFDGLLFFETHGVLSTLRFWAVASACRGRCIGSSLIRHYLATQTGVRRFVLWVNAEDQDVVQKYQHYHYASDGVVDYVLTNDCMFG